MTPPPVFLHQLQASDTLVPQDMATATASLVTHLVSRELSRVAHRALAGSGLRTRDLGTLVLCAGRELSIRSSVLAEQVADLLHLTETHTVGFGGPLAFYQGLFFAAASVEADQFSHVLLLEAAVSPGQLALEIGSYATLVGTTPGRFRYRGVCFGHLPPEDEEPAAAVGRAVRARFSLDGDRDLVYVADRSVDQGARFLAQPHERPTGSQLAIALRSQGHYAAALLEVGAQLTGSDDERLFQGPIQAHLRRAREAGFPLAFLRLVVSAAPPQRAMTALLSDEIQGRIGTAVRAFDEVSLLADGSFLVALPRAGDAALRSAKERLEGELSRIDPAGEMDLQVRCFGISVGPTESVSAEQVEKLLLDRAL